MSLAVPFRHLVSQYNCHITTTYVRFDPYRIHFSLHLCLHRPMILAKEFSRSSVARQSDFSTNKHERGIFTLTDKASRNTKLVRGSLIAQFAASEAKHFADAAELIWPHVDGIDLNCGTPKIARLSEIRLIMTRLPPVVGLQRTHRLVLTPAARNVGGNEHMLSRKLTSCCCLGFATSSVRPEIV